MRKVLFESGSATAATWYSPAVMSGGFPGARVYVDVTDKGAAGTLQVTLQALDALSGKWIDIPGAQTASISTVSHVTFAVHPALTTAANVAVSQVLADSIRAKAVVGTNAVTFSVGVDFLR